MKALVQISYQKHIPVTLIDDIAADLTPQHTVSTQVMQDQRIDHFEGPDVMDIVIAIDQNRVQFIVDNVVGPAVYDGVKAVALGLLWAMAKLSRMVYRRLTRGKRQQPGFELKLTYADVSFGISFQGNIPGENVKLLESHLLETMKSAIDVMVKSVPPAVDAKPHIRITYDPATKAWMLVDEAMLRQRAEAQRADLMAKLRDLSA